MWSGRNIPGNRTQLGSGKTGTIPENEAGSNSPPATLAFPLRLRLGGELARDGDVSVVVPADDDEEVGGAGGQRPAQSAVAHGEAGVVRPRQEESPREIDLAGGRRHVDVVVRHDVDTVFLGLGPGEVDGARGGPRGRGERRKRG